jgi:hypothetical protein
MALRFYATGSPTKRIQGLSIGRGLAHYWEPNEWTVIDTGMAGFEFLSGEMKSHLTHCFPEGMEMEMDRVMWALAVRGQLFSFGEIYCS